MADIVFLKTNADEEKIGRKGKSVSRLFQEGLNTPPGFILTTDLFYSFVKETGLESDIEKLHLSPETLDKAREYLIKLVSGKDFPAFLVNEIQEAYECLDISPRENASSFLDSKEELVAVRASVPKKDTFAGSSFLNVLGRKKLLQAIKACYASYIADEAMNISNSSGIAVIVQKMAEAEKSGTMKCTGDSLIISACFGQGTALSTGSVIPDVYTFDLNNMALKDSVINEKALMHRRDESGSGTITVDLHENSKKQVLYDREVYELARSYKRIRKLWDSNIAVEWGIIGEEIFFFEVISDAKKCMPVSAESVKTAPEIEIYDVPLSEDLAALEEIEKIESAPGDAIPAVLPESAPKEEKQEESIFSSYNVQRETDIEAGSFSGQLIISIDMFVLERLKSLCREQYGTEAKSFRELSDRLNGIISFQDINVMHEAALAIMDRMKMPGREDILASIKALQVVLDGSL